MTEYWVGFAGPFESLSDAFDYWRVTDRTLPIENIGANYVLL